MNLKRSVDRLSKKLDKIDLDHVSHFNNKTGLSQWNGRPIISLDEWIGLRNTLYALNYFPDDFDQTLTYLSEDDLEKGPERKDIEKWNTDYLELMEYTRNPNYGKVKCFHCLLNPAWDDPIFIGISRLVAKGLNNGTLQGDGIQYPCQVINRFQCPYERTNVKRAMNSAFDVIDLFKLEEMAFAVEISFAKVRKEDSKIRIRNKEELLHALTDKEIFTKILEQGSEAPEVSGYIRAYLRENQDYILDCFMRMKDRVNMEEFRFY